MARTTAGGGAVASHTRRSLPPLAAALLADSLSRLAHAEARAGELQGLLAAREPGGADCAHADGADAGGAAANDAGADAADAARANFANQDAHAGHVAPSAFGSASAGPGPPPDARGCVCADFAVELALERAARARAEAALEVAARGAARERRATRQRLLSLWVVRRWLSGVLRRRADLQDGSTATQGSGSRSRSSAMHGRAGPPTQACQASRSLRLACHRQGQLLRAWREAALQARIENLLAAASLDRLRAESLERGVRLRMELVPVVPLGAVGAEGADDFAQTFARDLAAACWVPEGSLVVLALRREPLEVDFAIREPEESGDPDEPDGLVAPNMADVLDTIRLQLSDPCSNLRCGEFAARVGQVTKLQTVIPMVHDVPLLPGAAGCDSDSGSASGRSKLRRAVSNGDDEDEDVSKRPECWGLRVRDLTEFHGRIKVDLGEYCSSHRLLLHGGELVHVCCRGRECPYGDHQGVAFMAEAPDLAAVRELLPNMHTVVARYVRPETRGTGACYALQQHPLGLRINVFVTHTWEEEFVDFVRTLTAACDPDDVVWVCSFALDQNANIEQTLCCELTESPFAVALRHAAKQIVVLDKDLQVPRRSWCAYELAVAGQFGIPAFIWPHHLSDISRLRLEVDSLDMRDAIASKEQDRQRILAAIESTAGGYAKLNDRLRSIMHVTLNFYQDASQKVADLTRRIEEAREDNDQVRQEALARVRAEELRRMEEVEAAQQRERHFEDRCHTLGREVTMLRDRLQSVTLSRASTVRWRLAQALPTCCRAPGVDSPNSLADRV